MPVGALQRHFLNLLDVSADDLRQMIKRGIELKQLRRSGVAHESLPHKTLAMIFEKSSTRTRVSFEAGMAQLGGSAIFLTSDMMQLGRGEPIEDTARVISSMVDIVMIRTHDHSKIERFAEYSKVPVINGLTDLSHPCQLLADMQTYLEERGDISGKVVTWIGDGNNMCNSYMEAAYQFDFQLKIACPEGYEPQAELLKKTGSHCEIVRDPEVAAKGSDLVVTDTWVSMGQEGEKSGRQAIFADYKVTPQVMEQAASDALFMHCLPAYRGMEVDENVLEGPQSAVWNEAENRLHAQKALLEYLLVD